MHRLRRTSLNIRFIDGDEREEAIDGGDSAAVDQKILAGNTVIKQETTK